jgi:alpha-D-ribose 1-methylphosphonate 5-triphosphate synthase subunit PhnL
LLSTGAVPLVSRQVFLSADLAPGSYQPSPFFVLDEVDAALDNTNVAKVANYIRAQASDTFQFIVISLKGSLYERGHSLVGIHRDQDLNSSRTLTLDVSRVSLRSSGGQKEKTTNFDIAHAI